MIVFEIKLSYDYIMRNRMMHFNIVMMSNLVKVLLIVMVPTMRSDVAMVHNFMDLSVMDKCLFLFYHLCGFHKIVDGSVRFLQDMGFLQTTLKCFDVMRLTRVVLTHVLFKSSLAIYIRLARNHSGKDGRVFLEDVETHLEDVVHFELIAEALLLVISIDVTESLASRRMFNSHFFTNLRI